MVDRRHEYRAMGAVLALALSMGMLTACTSGVKPVDATKLRELAKAYTSAWCGPDAAAVAAFFAPNGALKVNEAAPSVGRPAIAAVAQRFMTDLPDMAVKMEELSLFGGEIVYHFTLTGRNTGPGGTGKLIRVSGSEKWTVGEDGLITNSLRTFDEAEYQRQLKVGAPRIP